MSHSGVLFRKISGKLRHFHVTFVAEDESSATVKHAQARGHVVERDPCRLVFADVPGMAVKRAPTATASSARIIDRLTGGTSANIRKMPLRRSRPIPAMPFAKPRAPTEMAKPYWRIGVGRARSRSMEMAM